MVYHTTSIAAYNNKYFVWILARVFRAVLQYLTTTGGWTRHSINHKHVFIYFYVARLDKCASKNFILHWHPKFLYLLDFWTLQWKKNIHAVPRFMLCCFYWEKDAFQLLFFFTQTFLKTKKFLNKVFDLLINSVSLHSTHIRNCWPRELSTWNFFNTFSRYGLTPFVVK